MTQQGQETQIQNKLGTKIKRFLTGIHDRISDAITGETTMRGYDKQTGELVQTIKIKSKKDSDNDSDSK